VTQRAAAAVASVPVCVNGHLAGVLLPLLLPLTVKLVVILMVGLLKVELLDMKLVLMVVGTLLMRRRLFRSPRPMTSPT